MSSPKRVQMTRNKPWRKDHPDAVIVDRRTKWGNPFTVAAYLDAYDDTPDMALIAVVEAFSDWLHGDTWAAGSSADWEERRRSILENLGELRGKDLACWCGRYDPCHADVLLKLANEGVA